MILQYRKMGDSVVSAVLYFFNKSKSNSVCLVNPYYMNFKVCCGKFFSNIIILIHISVPIGLECFVKLFVVDVLEYKICT